jgi:hypothetical protein
LLGPSGSSGSYGALGSNGARLVGPSGRVGSYGCLGSSVGFWLSGPTGLDGSNFLFGLFSGLNGLKGFSFKGAFG